MYERSDNGAQDTGHCQDYGGKVQEHRQCEVDMNGFHYFFGDLRRCGIFLMSSLPRTMSA